MMPDLFAAEEQWIAAGGSATFSEFVAPRPAPDVWGGNLLNVPLGLIPFVVVNLWRSLTR